jgi:hypothetical protein
MWTNQFFHAAFFSAKVISLDFEVTECCRVGQLQQVSIQVHPLDQKGGHRGAPVVSNHIWRSQTISSSVVLGHL